MKKMRRTNRSNEKSIIVIDMTSRRQLEIQVKKHPNSKVEMITTAPMEKRKEDLDSIFQEEPILSSIMKRSFYDIIRSELRKKKKYRKLDRMAKL